MPNKTSSAEFTYEKTYEAILIREQIRELVAQYPDWDVEIATAIVLAESSGRTGVINTKDNHKGCSGSIGLWQLACFWGNEEDLKDPEKATEIAYNIYKKSGWKPWGSYTDLRYKKHFK